MRLLFLGTAAREGYPSVFCECENCREARALGGRNLRLRSALLVNDDLLLDMGPDLVNAAHRYGLSLSTVRTALITHKHDDHLYTANIGYRDTGCIVGERPTLLDLFGPADAMRDITDAYPDANGLLIATHVIKPFEKWETNGYRCQSFHANHGEGRIECLFYSVDDGRRRLLYATDTGPFSEATWQALSGQSFDCIVLEETLGTGQWPQHMNFERFLENCRRFRAEGTLREGAPIVAHHFSHSSNPVYEKVAAKLEPQGVIVAYDGLALDIGAEDGDRRALRRR